MYHLPLWCKYILVIFILVKIIAEGTYDSFMIQMVGRDKYNNKTFYGTWLEIPPIAKMISCDDTGYIQTTVIDKGDYLNPNTVKF